MRTSDQAYIHEVRETIRWAFRTGALAGVLNAREREVLELRYDAQANELHTIEQVGEAFGVVRERVRMIEANAMRKLRKTRKAQASPDGPPPAKS